VFLILVIINFVVITKGAGRVAEVSARFTLDAMPGKQMAIDADLNAGLIGEDEARQRVPTSRAKRNSLVRWTVRRNSFAAMPLPAS
jgi:flagellar biosynthesis protein FlhA